MIRDTACQTELRPGDIREQAHGITWDASSSCDYALENVRKSTLGQTASAEAEKPHNGCVFLDIIVPESTERESRRLEKVSCYREKKSWFISYVFTLIITKIQFEPPIASVKHCSRNLFHERTWLSREIWSDGLTCYLGVEENRISSQNIVKKCQRRLAVRSMALIIFN